MFTGDIFYCTSENAAIELRLLYENDKFIFDKNICIEMFSKSSKKANNNKKIVYFTEARDVMVDISIIKELIRTVKKLDANYEVFLKLHPKDTIENYKDFITDVKLIEEFDEAIQGNICIARKSTVLVEALYNQSIAIAVILNQKEQELYNLFPSLNDIQIEKVYSLKKLNSELLNHI